MGLTSGLVDLAVAIIDALWYPGVFILMTLESMIAPVPSEGVMPFAGFLVVREDGRRMDFWTVTAVATAGSLLGSYLSYEMGKHWGRPFIHRFGKYIFVNERDLEWTERFFQRRGAWAVLIGRFIPVVRHLISLPAGMGRMRLGPFFAATFVGAAMWNVFLTWIGMKLGQNWEQLKTWMEPVDYAIVALLVLGAAVYVWIHIKRARASPKPPGP